MIAVPGLTLTLVIAFGLAQAESTMQIGQANFSDNADGFTAQAPESSHCGPSSCFLLLRRLGKNVSTSEVDSHFDTKTGSVSFSEMQLALRSYGVETIGIRASIERLKSLSLPCIVQIRDPHGHFEHFQVVEPHSGGLMLLDPELSTPLLLTPELEIQYERVYAGMVLIHLSELTWLERQGRRIGVTLLATSIAIAFSCWVFTRWTRQTRQVQPKHLPTVSMR